MIKKATVFIFLCILLQASQAMAAEVLVKARVDRTSLSAGESLELEVTISNGKGEVAALSGLTDFKVLPRGTSSNVQIINGRMSMEQTHTFLLIPQGKGQLVIPALDVEVDGTTYTTEPITISVKEPTASGGVQADDKEIWVTAEISDPLPFQGQQVTYTFRLYNRIQINDAQFQPPEFKGFNAKEIKGRKSHRQVINGRDHIVTELYYVLSPLSAGPHVIDPAVLQVGVVRQNRRRSPFDDFFNRSALEQRVIQTETITVQVRPLPPLEGGLVFSGLVGRFDLSANMETTELNVGESTTVTVTVQGQGNVMDARSPAIDVPSAFKHYADNPEEAISLDRQGFSGKKMFRTALVPVESGEFTLPPVSLVYFDVGLSDYRTLTAAIPPVTVLASETAQAAPISIAPATLEPLKKPVTFTGRDILPPMEGLDAIAHRSPLSGVLFLFSLAAPAVLFLGAMALQRLRRQDVSPTAIMKSRARHALKQAQSNTGEATLSMLYQALTSAILAAAGRTGEALTWKEARALLKDCGKSNEEARQAAELLAQIESHKFSGAAMNEARRLDLLKQTETMVGKLAS
jgi:hypothetical protein